MPPPIDGIEAASPLVGRLLLPAVYMYHAFVILIDNLTGAVDHSEYTFAMLATEYAVNLAVSTLHGSHTVAPRPLTQSPLRHAVTLSLCHSASPRHSAILPLCHSATLHACWPLLTVV